ncbi:MAG: hypothetical protein WC756_19300 [Taibaiella sp.]|jgi:hypothetical protein
MKFTSDELELFNATKYRPAISIILSAADENGGRKNMPHRLKLVEDHIKKELTNTYPETTCTAILKKISLTFSSIDFTAIKNGIAVFVSPILSKIFYLVAPVSDKVLIDESFEIRDLVYEKLESFKYLALLITGRYAKAFLVDNEHIAPLDLGAANNIESYENDISERVLNFSDPSKRKELVQEKFLRGIDHALSGLLKSYRLPVFLVGVDRIIGHFKSISVNGKHIQGSIHHNYKTFSLSELKDRIKPFAAKYKALRTDILLSEIEKAMNSNTVVIGAEGVWENINENNSRLLIVEKNYAFQAEYVDNNCIRKYSGTESSVLHIKDAVDDIIEKAIQSGCEISFVDDGVLNNYKHIALIKYF